MNAAYMQQLHEPNQNYQNIQGMQFSATINLSNFDWSIIRDVDPLNLKDSQDIHTMKTISRHFVRSASFQTDFPPNYIKLFHILQIIIEYLSKTVKTLKKENDDLSFELLKHKNHHKQETNLIVASKCPICLKPFKSLPYLDIHVFNKHPNVATLWQAIRTPQPPGAYAFPHLKPTITGTTYTTEPGQDVVNDEMIQKFLNEFKEQYHEEKKNSEREIHQWMKRKIAKFHDKVESIQTTLTRTDNQRTTLTQPIEQTIKYAATDMVETKPKRRPKPKKKMNPPSKTIQIPSQPPANNTLLEPEPVVIEQPVRQISPLSENTPLDQSTNPKQSTGSDAEYDTTISKSFQQPLIQINQTSEAEYDISNSETNTLNVPKEESNPPEEYEDDLIDTIPDVYNAVPPPGGSKIHHTSSLLESSDLKEEYQDLLEEEDYKDQQQKNFRTYQNDASSPSFIEEEEYFEEDDEYVTPTDSKRVSLLEVNRRKPSAEYDDYNTTGQEYDDFSDQHDYGDQNYDSNEGNTGNNIDTMDLLPRRKRAISINRVPDIESSHFNFDDFIDT